MPIKFNFNATCASELPRLSSCLRTFGNVSAPVDNNIEDPDDLSKKRNEITERNSKLYSLSTVKDFLYKNSSCSSPEIDDYVKELRTLAREIVGSESRGQIVEGTVVYLLELFRGCSIISQKQKLLLRRMFGTYPPAAIDKVFKITNTLIDTLNFDVKEEVIKDGFPRHRQNAKTQEFGSKIKFFPAAPLDTSSIVLQFNEGDEDYHQSSTLQKFSFKFEAQRQEVEKEEPKSQIVNSVPAKKRFDQRWLEASLEESFPTGHEISVSSAEISLTVIQLLQSSRTTDELQNDLFDLLGFDRIELIQDILQHREEIVQSKIAYQMAANVKENMTNDKRPSCMTQVTIQSETEKILTKQLRKDEKRIQKEQFKNAEDGQGNLETDLLYAKQIREVQLLSAQHKPLFSRPSTRSPEINIYPNVFDIYAETRMSASFVSGRKLALPENHSRINNKMFEEIGIPPTTAAPATIGRELIAINTLDQIGQLAFKNIKSLNRIQSMVFNIAYHTNENMLVCAPTGAGKTNVALLTIIHELKLNIEDGMILKDKFKIVYVAPMKALAAEMVRNFSARLNPLGIQVKELTGDMQLTKNEIMQTQMLVTTPEKWDVVTRKSTGDIGLSQLVKLLILDEVHLLDGDRGPVLEALVARTLRQVETSQSMIRIIGLSATLPNYIDVANFLRVNPMVGLFFFDDRFRPVPLRQTFVGVKSTNSLYQMRDMDDICYEKVLKLVREKHQVMVFVHARNATVRTATILKDLALNKGDMNLFTEGTSGSEYGMAHKNILKSRNKQLRELFEYGFAIHHAGMLRCDRNLVERYFKDGHIKVLVCTSTLAWGVNLPARAVIIKGTELYDSRHGSFIDLNILDVMQIFGRAGRPQFDSQGEGTIITTHDKLSHYLSLLMRQHQIESKFDERLVDNLNAEIALGTVTSVDEGVEWLSYTYLYIRMSRNPHHYGLKPKDLQEDYGLVEYRKKMIIAAALNLSKAHMARYDPENGYLYVTDMGRTASHFYISAETISRFNEDLRYQSMADSEVFQLISRAQEFDQLKVRDDELVEMDHLFHECHLSVPKGCENTEGKVNILLQTYLSRIPIESFSLISDSSYVAQNTTRIIRSLFEVSLRKNWAMRTATFLRVCKMIEKQIWSTQTPLRQFPELSMDAISKLDKMNIDVEYLREMDVEEIGLRTRCQREKRNIKQSLDRIPNLIVDSFVQPITDCILRLSLTVKPDFRWSDKHHGGGSESFWIWVEDPESDYIYHFEYFIITKKQVIHKEDQMLTFTIPLARDVRPTQYLIRVISDRWLGSDRTFQILLKDLILPQHRQPHTDLLSLQPLPVKVLKNTQFERLYKFDYFNPIQTLFIRCYFYLEQMSIRV